MDRTKGQLSADASLSTTEHTLSSDTVLVEITFTGLPIDRDEIEETLEAAFGPDSVITDAGSGMGRRHLDLEIEVSMATGPSLDRMHAVLAELGIEASATVNISD